MGREKHVIFKNTGFFSPKDKKLQDYNPILFFIIDISASNKEFLLYTVFTFISDSLTLFSNSLTLFSNSVFFVSNDITFLCNSLVAAIL